MSIASVPSSSFDFERERGQREQREQPEQHYEQHQDQLLESINGHKERVRNASLRVEVLECQIREEVEKLFSLIGSSSHSVDSNSSSHHHTINKDDYDNSAATTAPTSINSKRAYCNLKTISLPSNVPLPSMSSYIKLA
mmetsp:Transcript_14398/g.23589  ORF Transcript_14398/g.23589 Transcript_14398/m.23589 type:complete len:139 (-) Transcript_14398:208-624(-)